MQLKYDLRGSRLIRLSDWDDVIGSDAVNEFALVAMADEAWWPLQATFAFWTTDPTNPTVVPATKSPVYNDAQEQIGVIFSCEIPWVLLDNEGIVYFGVWGSKVDNTDPENPVLELQITTPPSRFAVTKGVLDYTGGGDGPVPDPPAPLWEQILARLAQLDELAAAETAVEERVTTLEEHESQWATHAEVIEAEASAVNTGREYTDDKVLEEAQDREAGDEHNAILIAELTTTVDNKPNPGDWMGDVASAVEQAEAYTDELTEYERAARIAGDQANETRVDGLMGVITDRAGVGWVQDQIAAEADLRIQGDLSLSNRLYNLEMLDIADNMTVSSTDPGYLRIIHDEKGLVNPQYVANMEPERIQSGDDAGNMIPVMTDSNVLSTESGTTTRWPQALDTILDFDNDSQEEVPLIRATNVIEGDHDSLIRRSVVQHSGQDIQQTILGNSRSNLLLRTNLDPQYGEHVLVETHATGEDEKTWLIPNSEDFKEGAPRTYYIDSEYTGLIDPTGSILSPFTTFAQAEAAVDATGDLHRWNATLQPGTDLGETLNVRGSQDWMLKGNGSTANQTCAGFEWTNQGGSGKVENITINGPTVLTANGSTAAGNTQVEFNGVVFNGIVQLGGPDPANPDVDPNDCIRTIIFRNCEFVNDVQLNRDDPENSGYDVYYFVSCKFRTRDGGTASVENSWGNTAWDYPHLVMNSNRSYMWLMSCSDVHLEYNGGTACWVMETNTVPSTRVPDYTLEVGDFPSLESNLLNLSSGVSGDIWDNNRNPVRFGEYNRVTLRSFSALWQNSYFTSTMQFNRPGLSSYSVGDHFSRVGYTPAADPTQPGNPPAISLINHLNGISNKLRDLNAISLGDQYLGQFPLEYNPDGTVSSGGWFVDWTCDLRQGHIRIYGKGSLEMIEDNGSDTPSYTHTFMDIGDLAVGDTCSTPNPVNMSYPIYVVTDIDGNTVTFDTSFAIPPLDPGADLDMRLLVRRRQTIDLDVASTVAGIESGGVVGEDLVFTLSNGNTVSIPLSDLGAMTAGNGINISNDQTISVRAVSPLTVTADGVGVASGYTMLTTAQAGDVTGKVDATEPRAYTSTGTALITDRAAYYGSASVNGARQTSSVAIYAPTTVGTSGQVLTSAGSGAPSWGTLGTTTSAIKQGNTTNYISAVSTTSIKFIPTSATAVVTGGSTTASVKVGNTTNYISALTTSTLSNNVTGTLSGTTLTLTSASPTYVSAGTSTAFTTVSPYTSLTTVTPTAATAVTGTTSTAFTSTNVVTGVSVS